MESNTEVPDAVQRGLVVPATAPGARGDAKEGYMSQRSGQDADPDDDATYPVSVFGPQHHLTPKQVFDADRCLRRASNERRRLGGFRYSCQLGGIVSAAKAGRIANTEWGRHMAGKRGGRAMAEKHLDLLRELAPRAWRRSAEVRRLRKRRQDYERDRRGDAASDPGGRTSDPEQQRGWRPDTEITMQHGGNPLESSL